jgi:integrase
MEVEENLLETLNSLERGEPIERKDIPFPLSMDEIYELGLNADREDKFLLWLLYCSGGRVSEVLPLRKRSFTFELNKSVMHVELPTLKNRKSRIRIVPIPYNGQYKDSEMCKFVREVITTSDSDEEDRIFNYSLNHNNGRVTIYNHIKRFKKDLTVSRFSDGKRTPVVFEGFSLFPHFLRHCRLTHLVRYYHFDAFRLQKFAGWSSPAPASVYVQLDTSDLISQMV